MRPLDPTAPFHGVSRTASRRLSAYAIVNLAFILFICLAAANGPDATPRVLYLSLLFPICSSPLLIVRRLNDRYALYSVFLFIYFISFGALDVAGLIGLEAPVPDPALMDSGEILIVLGGIAFVSGYLVIVRRTPHTQPSSFVEDDWPLRNIVLIGLILWSTGTFATWYWGVKLTIQSLQMVNDTGQMVTTLLMLGRYAQPLGILLLAYAAIVSRSKLLWSVVFATVTAQVVLGFVTNTKGGAMMGFILVILSSYLVSGKIPKAWLLVAASFITVAFPIFMAYRTVVVGERGVTNAEAASNLGSVLQMAIAGEKRSDDPNKYEGAAFLERASVKGAVEMIVSRVGRDVPFQRGYTLRPLLTAFIPRLIWPDKPDVQTGLLVNQEFHLEQSLVYISPSHLGEIYWNFGWPGALIGMLLLGMLLGKTGVMCDLSTSTSVTRVLLLIITIYQTGVRFEGSIASEYSIWMRCVVGILIMHWLLSKRGMRGCTTQSVVSENHPAASPSTPPFANLMT